METSSFFDTESFSHPNERLGHHLLRVAQNAKWTIKRINPSFSIISNNLIERAVVVAAALHDLGKATKYFQEYLLTDAAYDKDLKAHANMSAVVVRELLQRSLQGEKIDSTLKFYLPLLSFLSVKRHHGYLKNIPDENTVFKGARDEKILMDQLAALNKNDVRIISQMLPTLSNIETDILELVENFSLPAFKSSTNIIFTKLEFDKLHPDKKIEYYFLCLTIFSSLLYSDKKDVILKGKIIEEKPVPLDVVENYRMKMGFGTGSSSIDIQKELAFKGVIESIQKKFDPGNHLYSITLPTGLGKTISSFKAAQKISEILGGGRRLIFTIPFTSIIDQTFSIYSGMIGTDHSGTILKHHHLAEPVYKANEETFDIDQSEFLIETWDSSVVVTTFVQLFESLITNSKSRLLKLPNIAHSVIVLDEVQNLPYKYWKLVNNTLKVFAKIYDVYFILLTATQPLIFEPENEITELVPDHESFFKIFNRTILFNLTASPFRTVELLAEHVISFALDNPNENILVIMNTRNSSSKLFEILSDNIPDDSLYYLSSSVSPFERKIIIDEIKKHVENTRKILVSTQLIEAGVDISFDTVFREVAPVDSVLQGAGRANRYNLNKCPSSVYIFAFEGKEDKSSLIYGSELMQASRQIFNSKIGEGGVSENHYLELIREYFTALKSFSTNLGCEYLNAVTSLEFENTGKFTLIEESKFQVSVFLLLNEEAISVWTKFQEIMKENIPIYEKKNKFAFIKSRFYEFVINVSVKDDERMNVFNREPEFGFQVWNPDYGDSFYSYSPGDFRRNRGFVKNTSAVL